MSGVTDNEPRPVNARREAHSKLQEKIFQLQNKLLQFNSSTEPYRNLEIQCAHIPELRSILNTTSEWLRKEDPEITQLAEDVYITISTNHYRVVLCSVEFLDDKENPINAEIFSFLLELARLELAIYYCILTISDDLTSSAFAHIRDSEHWIILQHIDTNSSWSLIFQIVIEINQKKNRAIEIRKEIEAAASRHEEVSE